MNPSPLLPYLVAGTFFMELLDGTVIATALPQMGASFGVGPADLAIGMTAYLLTLAVFIPVSGWVAERFGARHVFAAAITLFTLSSLLCGSSQTLQQFVTARVTQGIGGAMMVPVGRMAVLRHTPREGLVHAINTITWPGLLAPVLGPPVGGFLTTYATWRWIFWLNLPLGIVALAMTLWLVPTGRGAKQPFDWIGFVLNGLALGGLMFSMDALGSADTDLRLAVVVLAASLGLLVLAVRHATRHPHPMLSIASARIPTMWVNITAGSAFRVAFNTFPYLVPLLLQIGFGMTAFHAGNLILVGSAGDMAMKSTLPWLYRNFGFRRVLMVSGPLGVLATLSIATLYPGSPQIAIAVCLLGYGMMRSVQFGALNTISFVDVPPSMTASASTLVSMLMQVSTGMGVALGAVALHAAVWSHGGNMNHPSLLDFRTGIFASALVAAAAVIGYRTLPETAGSAVSGHVPAVRG
jgi:EmrB/QacA subfamily drug resistance transporter